MNIILEFLVAFFSTFGFSIFFRVPTKKIVLITSTLSGVIWVIYKYFLNSTSNYFLSGLIAAALIGIGAESCAIFYKKPATIFSLPCLIPLVPGAGMYYIMYYFIENDYQNMVFYIIQTLFTTSSLALGIVASQGVFRLFKELIKRYHAYKYNKP